MKHKRNNPMCDPWDSQGDEKCKFQLYCFLIKNENIISEEHKTKSRLKQSYIQGELNALKVGWLTQSRK